MCHTPASYSGRNANTYVRLNVFIHVRPARPYRYSMRLTTRKGRPSTRHCMMKRGGRYVHVVCVPQRVVQHVHLSRNFSAATPLPIQFGQCGCP